MRLWNDCPAISVRPRAVLRDWRVNSGIVSQNTIVKAIFCGTGADFHALSRRKYVWEADLAGLKLFYYRGLSEWGHVSGYLTDTCPTGLANSLCSFSTFPNNRYPQRAQPPFFYTSNDSTNLKDLIVLSV